MSAKKLGKQTFALTRPPVIRGFGSVGGGKEQEGPLGERFDVISPDDTFGQESWEKAESAMQHMALEKALERAGVKAEELDMLLAGDLLNQCVGSAFAARAWGVPFWGLYGACSTMGESLALGAMLLDGGFGQWAAAATSSHFCSAERQYRTPLEYGGQRPPTAQWTATAAGAVVLGLRGPGPRVTHVSRLRHPGGPLCRHGAHPGRLRPDSHRGPGEAGPRDRVRPHGPPVPPPPPVPGLRPPPLPSGGAGRPLRGLGLRLRRGGAHHHPPARTAGR